MNETSYRNHILELLNVVDQIDKTEWINDDGVIKGYSIASIEGLRRKILDRVVELRLKEYVETHT